MRGYSAVVETVVRGASISLFISKLPADVGCRIDPMISIPHPYLWPRKKVLDGMA